MKNHFSLWGFVSILLILALLPILGCAPATTTSTTSATSVKPKEVTLYGICDLSGPISPFAIPEVNGIKDCLEWKNSQGGIDGVPVKMVTRDTGYKLEQSLAAYAAVREINPKPLIIMTLASSDTEALRDRVNEDQIINFAQGTSTKGLYPAGYTYGAALFYPDIFGAFIDWVTNDWSKKTGEKVKLGILTWDTAMGKSILVDECLQYARSKGVEIVAQEVFTMKDLDVSTQLIKIKAAGANWVIDNNSGNGPAVINKSAIALGMLNRNLYDTTPGLIHRTSNQTGLWKASTNVAPDATEGLMGVTNAALWSDTDKLGVKLATAAADKRGMKAAEREEYYLIGWVFGDVMTEAINRAVKEVGWAKLDGAAVKAQFDKMRDYNSLELCKYTYSPGRPAPTQARVAVVKNGNLTAVSDWFECPDLRPAQFKK